MSSLVRCRADRAIAVALTGLPEWADAEVVLSYLSFGSEVETRGLIEMAWSAGKLVALPRCVPGTHQMRWYRVDDLEHLVRGPLGVEEPLSDPAAEVVGGEVANVLAVVPGLSFDPDGYRLGYGGGYYDRFLSGFCGASVGLCREAQLSAAGLLPRDEHDVPVRLVVTEHRVLRS